MPSRHWRCVWRLDSNKLQAERLSDNFSTRGQFGVMETGAIILCGGRSTRMGHDKATLPFGNEVMLQRVVRLLQQAVQPQRIVIVASIGQQLPSLPSTVTMAWDKQPERGPLEGLVSGLKAIKPGVEAVYVTSCDVPLLVPQFVLRMFELLESYEVAVPRDEYFHCLAAVYRPSVLPKIQKLLDANVLRMGCLLEQAHTREVSVSELRDADPNLLTLTNLNSPEDYERALALAGFAGTN